MRLFKRKDKEQQTQQVNAKDIADVYLTRTTADKNNLECIRDLLDLHEVETESLGFEPKIRPAIRGEERQVLINKMVEIVKSM